MGGSPDGSDRNGTTAEEAVVSRNRGVLISPKAGKIFILLSLAAAGAGFFLYYTIETLDEPIPGLGGFKLPDVWRLARLLLWAGLGWLFLVGPRKKHEILFRLGRIGWALWVLALPVALIWLAAVLLGPRWRSGSPLVWGRLAEAATGAAVLLGAVGFDFRASPWVARHRNLLLNLLALALGLAAAGLLAEFFVRRFFRPPVFPPIFVKSSIPGCEFELKPDFDGICPNVRVKLNSDGLRCPEIPRRKQRPRILTLGDSCTFGIWVEQDKIYPSILQKMLPGYEVINAGIPGYGMTQVLGYFEGKAVKFDPDIIAYMFVYDDITDPLVVDKYGFLRHHPMRNYGGKGTSPDRNRLFPIPIWLLRRSYLLIGVVARYHRFREGIRHSYDIDLLGGLLSQRWGWLEEKLVELRDAARRSGARFLFVVFPVGLSNKSVDRLLEIARKNGIEALDLRPVLGDAKTYVKKYMCRWDNHPNAAAHARIARAIYERLIEKGFVRLAAVANGSFSVGRPGGARRESTGTTRTRREVPPEVAR